MAGSLLKSGSLLKYCRRRAGISQRVLAARVGILQPAIARIESGRVVPSADSFERLVSACGFQLELRLSPGLDRTVIRELLRVSPRERLELAATEAANLEAFN